MSWYLHSSCPDSTTATASWLASRSQLWQRFNVFRTLLIVWFSDCGHVIISPTACVSCTGCQSNHEFSSSCAYRCTWLTLDDVRRTYGTFCNPSLRTLVVRACDQLQLPSTKHRC